MVTLTLEMVTIMDLKDTMTMAPRVTVLLLGIPLAVVLGESEIAKGVVKVETPLPNILPSRLQTLDTYLPPSHNLNITLLLNSICDP